MLLRPSRVLSDEVTVTGQETGTGISRAVLGRNGVIDCRRYIPKLYQICSFAVLGKARIAGSLQGDTLEYSSVFHWGLDRLRS